MTSINSTASPVRVFISYSHDSPAHKQRVLQLANALRDNGIDAELDQYHEHAPPPQGWPRWCEEQLRPQNAAYVLMICTKSYHDRIEGQVPANEGRGVFWEGGIIYSYVYDAKLNARFIPVLLEGASEDNIVVPMRGYAAYRLTAFDLADEQFESLLRRLTQQPAVIKPILSPPPALPPRNLLSSTGAPPSTASPVDKSASARGGFDISRIIRYSPEKLIGREAETKLLEDAWAQAQADATPRPNVLTFVALGGEGKTSLVAHWAAELAYKGWPGCEAAFAWSFYSQGTREQMAASSDLFLRAALAFFGDAAMAESAQSAFDKGKRLAQLVAEKRALLILDGLEPLQYAPTSPTPGELKDEGLKALLKGLAQNSRGLCVVTTRYSIPDLRAFRQGAAPEIALKRLSKEAGVALLRALGVKGTQKEYEKLVEDVKGHALTLNLLGSFLRDAHGGDIRQRDLVKLEEADEEELNGHAFRAMDAYAQWFESEGEKGKRALAMLRLLGLFDRPADAGCLDALWKAPAIAGLTEPLVAIAEAQRNIALKRLEEANLLTVNRDKSGALVSLDAHPLLREYFARELRKNQAAWQAAHKRLFEHLCETTKDKEKPTLDDLQPLYQAVAHGCQAGMQQEACDKVYFERILRGTGSDGFYSTNKLGAFGSDLGAVACFFDPPWSRVSDRLSPADQAWLLNVAAFNLRALGRLTEALEPMRAGLDADVKRENWKNAATAASNLSELELTLGDVAGAVKDAEVSVTHADRSGDWAQSMSKRATHADALHQAGRGRPARFAEAEAMQAEQQPDYPLLYSLRGFRYCDLLLGPAERAAWRFMVQPSSPPTSLRAAGEAIQESRAAPGWLPPRLALAMTGRSRRKPSSTPAAPSPNARRKRSGGSSRHNLDYLEHRPRSSHTRPRRALCGGSGASEARRDLPAIAARRRGRPPPRRHTRSPPPRPAHPRLAAPARRRVFRRAGRPRRGLRDRRTRADAAVSGRYSSPPRPPVRRRRRPPGRLSLGLRDSRPRRGAAADRQARLSAPQRGTRRRRSGDSRGARRLNGRGANLLPLAGEGGPAKPGRMRDAGLRAKSLGGCCRRG